MRLRTLRPVVAFCVVGLAACEDQPFVPQLDEEALSAEVGMDGVTLANAETCITENYGYFSPRTSWVRNGYRYSGRMWSNFGALYTWSNWTIRIERVDGQPFTVRSFNYITRHFSGATDFKSSKGGSVRVTNTRQRFKSLSLANNPDFQNIQWFLLDPATGGSSIAIKNVVLCTGGAPPNSPPSANAGPDQTLPSTGVVTAVTLDGSGSSDPDGDALNYAWSGPVTATGANPTLQLGLGSHTFTLTVDDGRGGSATDDVTVEIVNLPPSADAGPDQTVEATGLVTTVSLDGSGSSDPNGDVLTYFWSGPQALSGATPTVGLGLGTHVFTLTVDDGHGETDTDDVVVNVVDRTAPEIAATQSLSALWPVNHKMVHVVTFSAADLVDASPSLSVAVSSNEHTDANGDGNTEVDWDVIENPDGSFDVEVRAERSGTGDGRTYTITATATDASGNANSETITVSVLKNRGVGNGAN